MIARRDPRDLATVDLALERARELTMRRLAQQGRQKSRRPFVPRDQRVNMAVVRRDERDERRQRQVDRPVPVQWSANVRERFDAMYDRAETRAQAEMICCGVRELTAHRLNGVTHWARAHDQPEPEQFDVMAEKLRRARRVGYWGEHLDTGELVMRFRDRSGLTILDPSEARQRQAELVRRLVPEIQRLRGYGLRAYYAVASEPNIPSGSLAWGKAHLFERFRRVVLGRGLPGTGPVPEIVGAFAVQEDPLAIDEQNWNVHLNLILIVDPKQCTRLDEDLMKQLDLELRGNAILKFPERRADQTPRGCLSYAKIHHLWGSDQFHIRPIEARNDEELGKRLLEVVKYSAKWVSNKQLDEIAAAAGIRRAHSRGLDGFSTPCGPGRSGSTVSADACEPRHGAAPGQLFAAGTPGGARRRAAPGLTEWPDARIAEWIRANKRFRRVRGWGVLYRIAKEDRPDDPDEAGRIRWMGRVFISPRGVVVHAAALSFVSSTHGVKSERDFPGSTGRSAGALARAGPAWSPEAA